MKETVVHPVGSKRATVAPLRWIGAVISIVYGFAKLNGSQFTVLDSELAKPLGEVSGFWLTWHYFGYSAPYGALIALLQIGGGILLVWPRTALFGALLLFPMFTNIALVDLFFGIDLGAALVALAVLGCLVAVIAPHAERLRAAMPRALAGSGSSSNGIGHTWLCSGRPTEPTSDIILKSTSTGLFAFGKPGRPKAT